MWIVQLALRRPYAIGAFALLILLGGGMAGVRLRSDVLPAVDIPVVLVVWNYGGLPAEEMEKRIVYPSERSLSSTVHGIARIESQSISGVGLIKAYFEPGTELGEAIAQINGASSAATRNMPPGTRPPIVMPYNAANVPVAQITVSGIGRPEEDLVDFAAYGVRMRLFTIPGVAVPAPYGGKYRQINVDVDAAAAAARGLSEQEVTQAVLDANPNLPGGTARLGSTTFDVAINNSPRSLDELKRVVVKNVEGVPVLLGDVANVYNGTEARETIVHVGGNRATYLAVVRKANASTIAVVDATKAIVAEAQRIAPEGVALKLQFDQSIFVRAAIDGVLREGLVSAALVTLLVLVALGSWRSVVIVATSIPLAVAVALAGLYVAGETLNLMTIGGLGLAIGMLVDDAMVEIENIHRNRHMGKPVVTAILDGAAQVAMPALASTLAICVVFAPVLTLSGPARYLFTPLALAVVLAMLASYFLSRTLVPTLARLLLLDGAHPTAHRKGEDRRDRFFAALQRVYGRAMVGVMSARGAVLAAGVLAVVVVTALVPVVGLDFFPEVDVGLMRMHVRAHSGLRLEETEHVVEQVERIVREVIPESELDAVASTVGVPTGYNMAFIQTDSVGSQDADVLVSLRANHAPTAAYRRRLREAFATALPGTHVYFQPADIVSQVLNFGQSAPIDVEIEGKDLEASARIARALRDRVREIPGTVDVRLAEVLSHPALAIDVDRAVASRVGVSQREIANDVLTSLNSSGVIAPSYWLDPETNVSYLVAVQSSPDAIRGVDDLAGTPLGTTSVGANEAAPVGRYLGTVASVRPSQSSASIHHDGVQRVVDLQCGVEGRDLGSVSREIARAVAALGDLPAGTRVHLRGQAESMGDSFRSLGLGMVVSGALAYLILVVLFQSWVEPLIVMAALPGGAVGVLLALAVTHTSLNVESLMGSLMVVGLAVSNSILVVAFAKEWRGEHPGRTRIEAAIAAGSARLRPVLMTATAMVLGMIPMAIGAGEGGEQNASLGRAVIGGLLGSTLATLVFVPIAFSVVRRESPR